MALLVCVPITSTPLLSQTAGGETPVGPLSLFPLAALVLLWLAPYILRGGKLPGLVKPLLAFAVVSIAAAGMAAFLPILAYKGQIPIAREARALATLAIGLSFYLAAAVLPDTELRRRASVRAIYAGALLTLAWSTVQAGVVLSRADHVPLVITQIHHLFSVRDLLIDRVMGMAYEPSWLGNQLMVLYVPLLASSTLERQSVFPWRRGWLSVESVMLVWSLLVLALTKSRISQVSFLVLASVILAVLAWKALREVQRRLGLAPPPGWNARRLLLGAVNSILLVAIVAALILGAGAAATQMDPRLWALPSIRERIDEIQFMYPNDGLFALGDRLAFSERIVYWTAAFRTFSLHPLLGVGPGNAGFFFEQALPEYGYRLAEIQALIRESSFGFPNPKNLWAKLLAETGIAGFLLFCLWFASMGIGAAVLRRGGEGLDRTLGLAGMIVFLTQLVEGFSMDTFALPQLWLVFGLATAALWRSQAFSPKGASRKADSSRNVGPTDPGIALEP
jgi:O-antigen ligase